MTTILFFLSAGTPPKRPCLSHPPKPCFAGWLHIPQVSVIAVIIFADLVTYLTQRGYIAFTLTNCWYNETPSHTISESLTLLYAFQYFVAKFLLIYHHLYLPTLKQTSIDSRSETRTFQTSSMFFHFKNSLGKLIHFQEILCSV